MEQLCCIAQVPKQPLEAEPPTHCEFQLVFRWLGTQEPAAVDKVCLRMRNSAAEGCGGRLRAWAAVPLAARLRSVATDSSGLWHVLVRARLLWEKLGTKNLFEHSRVIEASTVIPSTEVARGDASAATRARCIQALQQRAKGERQKKATGDATGQDQTKDESQCEEQLRRPEEEPLSTVLKQLLMAWGLTSRGDEAAWLEACGLPETEARELLREWLLDPLEVRVSMLRRFLNARDVTCMPAGLFEAWDAGKKTQESWRMLLPNGEALAPARGCDIGLQLEELQRELGTLVMDAMGALDRPLRDPLALIDAEVARDSADMEVLWRARSEGREALAEARRSRLKIAAMIDGSNEEAEVGKRIIHMTGELRRGMVVAEESLIEDLEAKLEEIGRILGNVAKASESGNVRVRADAVHHAISYCQNLLQAWSNTEERSRGFWEALNALDHRQLEEARGAASPIVVWTAWGCGFQAAECWTLLNQKADDPTHTENEAFRKLLQDLKARLSELLIVALPVLLRTLEYPLVYVEENFGSDFGKVNIGGYEALQLCINMRPRIDAMAKESGPAKDVGQKLLEMAARLQDQVLADIRSTSKDLQSAVDEAIEVEELMQALKSLDFDLTRWNFLRPSVERMSTSPGAVGDMMKRLLGLADKVRAQADQRDLQHIRGFVFQTIVTRTIAAAPAKQVKIEIASGSGLQPSQEVVIGGEYNRIRSLEPMGLVHRLGSEIKPGTDVCRLEISPLIVADATPQGKTQAFLDTVDNFNENTQPSADEVVKRFHGWLPTDAKARMIALLSMYTVNDLYLEVNRAIYENDRARLQDYAGYIRELLGLFLVGQPDPLVAPFVGGVVVRSMILEESQLQQFSDRYLPGESVCWSAFTSTFDVSNLSKELDGNLVFQISCGKLGGPQPGQHYPVSVKAFSAFLAQNEVLFPPHCFFRIVNTRVGDGGRTFTLEMETMEATCVWELIRLEDWGAFEAWAAKNSEQMDTRVRRRSMIGTIAASISKPIAKGTPNPIDVCVRHGVDVNEVDNERNQTALAIVEHRYAHELKAGRPQSLSAVLAALIDHGATAR